MSYLFRANINSDIKEMNNLIEKILNEFEGRLDETLLFGLRLILSELIINAMEHGNSWDKNKYVSVSLLLNYNEIIIEVSDEGNGVRNDKENHEELKPSGRGLLLVENLVDEMHVKDSLVRCRIRL